MLSGDVFHGQHDRCLDAPLGGRKLFGGADLVNQVEEFLPLFLDRIHHFPLAARKRAIGEADCISVLHLRFHGPSCDIGFDAVGHPLTMRQSDHGPH